MSLSQTSFTDALFDAAAPRPAGLSDGVGRAAGRRFDVYRNNIIVSLTEALETAFPVVRKLVGEANFKILARAFVEKHPPSSPLMMYFGGEMPTFLEAFEPVQSIGYLPDMARLEIGLRESYHAADAAAIDPTALQRLDPDRLMASRLGLVPSARLVRSRWPIHAIWRFNSEPGAPKPAMAAEDVLVLRPVLDPEPHLLPPGGGAFLESLMRKMPLAEAIAAAGQETEAFDLAGALALLISGNAIFKIGEDP
ncbi:MAG: DNA-binding domain-containing protein [Pseudomonadota bacterium]